MTYAPAAIWSEITYLAYHLHWGMDTLLDLEHAQRGMLIDNVAALNTRAWEEVKNLG